MQGESLDMDLRVATEISLRDSQKGRLHYTLLLPIHSAFLWERGICLQISQKRLHEMFTPLGLEERNNVFTNFSFLFLKHCECTRNLVGTWESWH